MSVCTSRGPPVSTSCAVTLPSEPTALWGTRRPSPPKSAPPAICAELRFDTRRSPTAPSGLVKSPLSSLKLTSAMPCHPAAMPRSCRSSMGPPPLTACAVKPWASSEAEASMTKLVLTQCRSVDTVKPSSDAGCSRHSSAPASRALTLIFPAEPCQMLPEKSSACTDGGRKCVITEAGKAAMLTASSAASPMRMAGQRFRERGAALASRLAERNAGIHRSRLGSAIHRDRLDREPIALVERGERRNHGVEGRSLELHADAGAVGLGAAQSAAETRLAADPVDQHHRRLARVGGQLTAGGANLRGIDPHPGQILALRFIALDRARHRRLQRHQYAEQQDQNRHGDSANRDHALFAWLQTGIPGA